MFSTFSSRRSGVELSTLSTTPEAYDGVDGTGGVRDRESRCESRPIPLVSSGKPPAAEPGCVAESPKSGGTFDPGCCGRARPPGSGEETLLPATCVLAQDGQLRKSERRNLVRTFRRWGFEQPAIGMHCNVACEYHCCTDGSIASQHAAQAAQHSVVASFSKHFDDADSGLTGVRT